MTRFIIILCVIATTSCSSIYREPELIGITIDNLEITDSIIHTNFSADIYNPNFFSFAAKEIVITTNSDHLSSQSKNIGTVYFLARDTTTGEFSTKMHINSLDSILSLDSLQSIIGEIKGEIQLDNPLDIMVSLDLQNDIQKSIEKNLIYNLIKIKRFEIIAQSFVDYNITIEAESPLTKLEDFSIKEAQIFIYDNQDKNREILNTISTRLTVGINDKNNLEIKIPIQFNRLNLSLSNLNDLSLANKYLVCDLIIMYNNRLLNYTFEDSTNSLLSK